MLFKDLKDLQFAVPLFKEGTKISKIDSLDALGDLGNDGNIGIRCCGEPCAICKQNSDAS